MSPHRSNPERGTRGQVVIVVTTSLAMLLAMAVLALDVGRVLLARAELQNAADAAALAGLAGLRAGSPAQAAALAIQVAGANLALADSGLAPVTITAGDVSFPQPDVIRVTTHRTQASGDALRGAFTRIVNASAAGADVTATAEAQVQDICLSTCVRPFGLCDRFTDADGDGTYDPGEPYDPAATGYQLPADVGLQLVLRSAQAGDPMQLDAFYSLEEPPLDTGQGAPVGGGGGFFDAIVACAPYLVAAGDSLLAEPGLMHGQLRQGVEVLIQSDPGAYWDAAARTVRGSAYAQSPRLVRVGLVDPTFLPGAHAGAVRVSRLAGFFLESVEPNGRMTVRLVDLAVDGAEPCPAGSPPAFLHRRRLVA
jgi:hypothetical protein